MFNSKVVYYNTPNVATENNSLRNPATDIFETDKFFSIVIQIPGVKKEDVSISFSDGLLTVTAVKQKRTDSEQKYILREISPRSYQKKFKLSDSIDNSAIEADYLDGLLTLTLPKKPETQPRSINIK